MNPILCTFGLAALGALVFIAIGLVVPAWFLFTMTKAVGFGLVALGLVGLLRGGLLSFGQGLYYCGGAYVSGLMANWAGVTDMIVLLSVGCIAGGLIAALVSPLVARYRGIFFAMLTMALSMVAYGVLTKIAAIGGSDGFNVPKPTLLGYHLAETGFGLYAIAVVTAALAAAVCRVHFDSGLGLIASAARENELRIEYLGASVFSVSMRSFILAGGLAGLGGTLNGVALGHVDPFFSYWTTSGEMVFIAILGGYASVTAVFGTALITELVRSFSGQYFPESWQMLLGIFLLLVIVFLPRGVGSMWAKPAKNHAIRSIKEPAT
ncbi:MULTISPECIES: branched-chain amino acid ABC transporter permease [unclassified Shinella]|uniref:branched-chain amino acid ABC transporter permease n=1 Tax=unclassified Shinella TaxID=2643062 RepID=UPI00225D41BD|nr:MULTISPECIES: branched-chain amino acid ABC transporter permease [unclassified Shinella]MCO5136358.1 branched-chain amino acid ABC transporter permease [Shinella sp.]MDC7253967.1 branched-chain amino acid ABC transporter permease [Shinella sp. YE25]CAI0336624.1 Branched-chain amino acid ABC transporter permease [Rhizobiaceae bacterium]CAK7255156.1 Branched-chain amino acid ABC transporter permease [Shinella sp. WSC3-e]